MKETEFQQEYLEKIKSVLKFVLESPFSNFYREKYKNLDIDLNKIKTYKDFQKIPLLKKDELISTPLDKRSYVPEDKLKYYTLTSGTTNKKRPLIMPHSYSGNFFNKNVNTFDEENLNSLGVNKIVTIFPILSSFHTILMFLPRKKTLFIPGDPNRLDLTALVLSETKAQGIITTPTILYFLAEKLKELNFNFPEIKWVWIGGEYCTKQKFDYLKSLFPNAIFERRYGAAEITSGLSPRGYWCPFIRRTDPNYYHIYPSYFLEAINNGADSTDDYGEIIHTDLEFEKRAFPLIRYQTGDVGKIKKDKCQCGNEYFISVAGRKNTDVLNFSGVSLYSHLIENSLNNVRKYLKPVFEMHVYEKKTGKELIPELVLKISLNENIKPTNNVLEEIKNEVQTNLQLSPTKKLSYFVENKIFFPLKIENIPDWPEDKMKTKAIVSHL
jgi:phenylacetate-CoA ligase